MPRQVRRPSDWNDPDLWGYHLDDQRDRNARLYGHGATFYADLPVLTELWLSQLRNVGLSSAEGPPKAAAKQQGPRPHDPSSEPEIVRAQKLQRQEAQGQGDARSGSWRFGFAKRGARLLGRYRWAHNAWLKRQHDLRFGSREVELRVSLPERPGRRPG